MGKKETQFQKDLIDELKEEYPGCIVLKNDPNYIQGIPDLTVLYKDRWVTLECKKSEKESHQPNQDYYVKELDNMSFSRFVYPENKNEILIDLRRYFKGDNYAV